MKAILYERCTEGEDPKIVDYGIRIEERELFPKILTHVIDYAIKQDNAPRRLAVESFLSKLDAGNPEKAMHFDITLTEARFACDALRESTDVSDTRIVPQLQGRIDLENAFMMGLHESKYPHVRDVYQGIGYVSIAVDEATDSPGSVAV